VLALAALVSLAPYDVPCWLPALLERLAGYFNAPQPIKGVVTKAFADFKRTHQDNWAAHKERLTYEQQELISDMLISPSFYA
jgi:proteasome activator subunit 4